MANDPFDAPPVASSRPGALGRVADPASPALTYAGIAAMAVGFLLIAIGWADVAGQRSVAAQLPYLVSAGFTGLGLIIAGALTANVAAKRQDAVARDLQLATLVDAVRELRDQVETALEVDGDAAH